jgi:hypothetical protein
MSVLQRVRERQCHLDVRTLRCLVAAAQQHEPCIALPHEIDAVTRTAIDLHLAQPTGQHAVLSGVADCKTIDPCLYAHPRLPVAQRNEPVLEYPRLPDLDHAASSLTSIRLEL